MRNGNKRGRNLRESILRRTRLEVEDQARSSKFKPDRKKKEEDWKSKELLILYENRNRNMDRLHSSETLLESAEAAKSVSPISEVPIVAVDGSGEKPAPIAVSAVSETVANAAPAAAAAGGDTISPVDTTSANTQKAVPVAPTVTPVTGGEQSPQFPPATSDPIAQPALNPSEVANPALNPSAPTDVIEVALPEVLATSSESVQEVSKVVDASIVSTPITLEDSAPLISDSSESVQGPGVINVVDPSIFPTPVKDDSPAMPVSEANVAPIDAARAPIVTATDASCPAIAAKAGLAAALVNTVSGLTLAVKEAVPEVPVPINPAELSPTVSAIPAISASLAAVPAAAVTLANVPAPAVPVQSGPDIDDSATNDEWTTRQSELLNAVLELESAKRQAASDALRLQLKARDEEIEQLKTRVQTLENELVAALSKPGTKNHVLVETIKQQHGELLDKARGMLFDKTKIVKNQELQIEALTAQVASLKDVNSITKDLLEIRNSEIKHLEERLESMESRFKAEKQRHLLVLNRAETGQSINNDLKAEYETQLKIFKELREKYEQRVQALMAENKRLAESVAANASAGTQSST